MPTDDQKRTRRTWRDQDHTVCGRVCGEDVSEGGWHYNPGGKLANWLSPEDLEAFEKRVYDRSVEHAPKDSAGDRIDEHQCGGCKYFGALNGDYGFCINALSPNDGRVVFEHGGCAAHSQLAGEVARG